MPVNKLKRDLSRNDRVSPFRKLFWVLLFMRLEQSCDIYLVKKTFALGKKITLAGTGCQIPAASISGGGFRVPHLNGIIISSDASIGEDCTLFHQVTLGINERKKGAPQLGDRVTVCAGAKLIGPITVGNDVTIGANAVITKDVGNGLTVVGFNKVL